MSGGPYSAVQCSAVQCSKLQYIAVQFTYLCDAYQYHEENVEERPEVQSS